MSSKLVENLSSDYVEASNSLKPKTHKKDVLVYVESDEDVAFWRTILSSYATDNLRFNVTLPTSKGKKKALEKNKDLLNLNVGKYLIICVDSDYDYVIQNATIESTLVNNSKFIFQTYSYSLENLLCYIDSLHNVCVQATKRDDEKIDLKGLLLEISTIIYDLLIWNIYFRKIDNHTDFTLSDFCATIKILDRVIISDYQSSIRSMQDNVNKKLSELKNNFPAYTIEVEKLKNDLKKLGVNEKTAYLFVQGHTLKDNIVLMILNPLCKLLREERIIEIRATASHNLQIMNDINHYNKQTEDVAKVLRLNTEFKSCFLYLKILADFENYLKQIS